MGKGFNWATLKRRYGSRISIISVDDGSVVLYRDNGVVRPIYKIQSSIQTKQRIEFYERAEAVADQRGMSYERTEKSREIKFN
jgi:hypothetical protein